MQVVERRQQLAVREIAGAAEDDERDRSVATGGLPTALRSRRSGIALLTAWPPNWLRSAASRRSANGLSSRERKRVKSAAVMTGSGTAALDGLLQRPASFAGVLDVALERRRDRDPRPARAPSARAATIGRRCRASRARRPRRGRCGTRSRASARSLRRTPASGRTRCRCGSSSRSGRRRGRRRAGSRSGGASVRKIGSRRLQTSASPPTIRQ